jgi:hypothetical protein
MLVDVFCAEVCKCLLQGGYKLKIPTMLLSEKERTRNRFARIRQPAPASSMIVDEEEDDSDEGNDNKQEELNVQEACSSHGQSPVLAQKIVSFVEEDILCLAHQAEKGLLPAYTLFTMTERDHLQHLVNEMRKECPSLCCNGDKREEFVFTMLSMLEQHEDP